MSTEVVGLWNRFTNWNFDRFFNKVADGAISSVRNYGRAPHFIRDYEIVGKPGEIWRVTVERVADGRPIGSSQNKR